MRKLVVLSFISLDGVVQAPGGPEEDPSGGFAYGGWTVPYFDEALGSTMDKQMGVPYDLLLGRKTYDIFASYWPRHTSADPAANSLNKATKYVVSRGNPDLTWESSILISGDIVSEIRTLKSGDGPELQVHGSGNLIQTLLRENLIDELKLKIFPITLGKGKRLFGKGTQPEALRLIESAVSPSGVIIATYGRAGEIKTGSF